MFLGAGAGKYGPPWWKAGPENSALAVSGPLGCAVRFYYSLEAAGSLGGGASKVGGEMLGQERFRFPEGSTRRG